MDHSQVVAQLVFGLFAKCSHHIMKKKWKKDDWDDCCVSVWCDQWFVLKTYFFSLITEEMNHYNVIFTATLSICCNKYLLALFYCCSACTKVDLVYVLLSLTTDFTHVHSRGDLEEANIWWFDIERLIQWPNSQSNCGKMCLRNVFLHYLHHDSA